MGKWYSKIELIKFERVFAETGVNGIRIALPKDCGWG